MHLFFKQMAKPGQGFPLFSFFPHDNISQICNLNDKSLDCVLGTQTHGGRIVGSDESTEPLLHPT